MAKAKKTKLVLEVDEQELRDLVRISGYDLDEELETLRKAYLMDLSRAGVEVIPEDDSLVRAGLRCYLRWQMNYNGEADRYQGNYLSLRNAMSLASEYRTTLPETEADTEDTEAGDES